MFKPYIRANVCISYHINLKTPKSPNFGSHIFGHISPVDRVRELFKSPKNAESLVVLN